MDYVSPYLQNSQNRFSSALSSRRNGQSASEILSDDSLSVSEKHRALDRLENDALAAFTIADENVHMTDAKSPARLLEEVMAAKRSLHHAS